MNVQFYCKERKKRNQYQDDKRKSFNGTIQRQSAVAKERT